MTAPAIYRARFPIVDRDLQVGALKREALHLAWLDLDAKGCNPTGPSEITIDHDEATITVEIPVTASPDLPRHTLTPITEGP